VTDVREFLHRSIGTRNGGIISISVPAPTAGLTTLARLFRAWPASIWRAPDGHELAGVGSAASVTGCGPARFAMIRESATELFGRTTMVAPSGVVAASPILIGGVAFAPGWGSSSQPWRPFGDASFLLHRWTYESHSVPTLTLALDLDNEESKSETALDEFDRIIERFSAEEESSTVQYDVGSAALVDRIAQMPLAEWTSHIRAIQLEFSAGRFLKLVAARRGELKVAECVDPMYVLTRLAREFDHCTAFLFRREAASFVGATPETLFSSSGASVRSQALAGSIMAGPDAEATKRQTAVLSHSRKNLQEHDLVVREIVSALRPFCTDLALPPPPTVIRVRNLLHLNTPIEGELRSGVHPVDLMEALHPTPAMGGFPRTEAVDWIASHERDPRGWYTGPIGWMNAEGDAEFDVAIRCGVIDGNVAHVYTGAGIVVQSNPAAEYHETSMKQRPFLRALGALS
jgi:menaquinone-specific isochorismate synthase